MLNPIKSIIFLLLVIFLFQGCADEIKQLDSPTTTQLTKFLIDNETTRKEVIDRLGTPTKRYEHDNILIYRVCEEEELITLPNPKKRLQNCLVDLVLVFSSDGILKQHSLVKGIKQ